MLLTEKLANDIVTRAMGIIHHNVNVINSQGVIIASGEKNVLVRLMKSRWKLFAVVNGSPL